MKHRENAVADRRFYAFRSWPSSLCLHCKRDVLVKLDQHYCAVGVQCRDGCGQLVSLRGDGAVLGWSSGMPHTCPIPLKSRVPERRTQPAVSGALAI